MFARVYQEVAPATAFAAASESSSSPSNPALLSSAFTRSESLPGVERIRVPEWSTSTLIGGSMFSIRTSTDAIKWPHPRPSTRDQPKPLTLRTAGAGAGPMEREQASERARGTGIARSILKYLRKRCKSPAPCLGLAGHPAQVKLRIPEGSAERDAR